MPLNTLSKVISYILKNLIHQKPIKLSVICKPNRMNYVIENLYVINSKLCVFK